MSDRAGTDRRTRRGHRVGGVVVELLVVLVAALVVASLLRAFVGQVFVVPTGSMENTLRKQDRIVVEKLSSTDRGEVVVFADPGGWLEEPAARPRGAVGRVLEFVGVLPDTSTGYLTKRVVGLPGDEVACCDTRGRLTVNGQPLDERDYLYATADGGQVEPSAVEFDVTVPADRVFVLGDHRDDSRDSRCHLDDPATATGVRGGNAFVPEDLVVGRAVAVAWPWSAVRTLRTPSTYDAVPAGRPAPAQPEVDAGPDAEC